MMEFLIGVGVGVVGASVAWFFVWRNNKEFMKAKLEDLEAKLGDKL